MKHILKKITDGNSSNKNYTLYVLLILIIFLTLNFIF